MNESFVKIYSQPSNGNYLPYYRGVSRELIGHGVFGSLMRYTFPIAKALAPHALNVVHDVVNKSAPILTQALTSQTPTVINKLKRKLNNDDIFTQHGQGNRKRIVKSRKN